MRLTFLTVLAIVMLVPVSFSQEMSRDDKIRKIHELRGQISTLELDILLPDASDIDAARRQGATAVRLLPREQYDGMLVTRGGGAYYSFARKTHEYGQGSDISLERGRLSVGFAGYDYGFFADLGNIALSAVTTDTPEIAFLIDYKPAMAEAEIRLDREKSRNYATPAATYTHFVQAVIGRTYVLRSLSFSRSDLVVVFNVARKDVDGSLILHWKLLKEFGAPPIIRQQ